MHSGATWDHLVESVRNGKGVQQVEAQALAEEFFPTLVRGLHVLHLPRAKIAARVLGAGTSHKGMNVVDVGCGTSVWGIAVAEADPTANITAQDYPALFELTRQYVKRHGVTDRYDYLPGDLKTVDFGQERFDLALLGNIVHSEGVDSSCDLFRRLHRALKPGGRIVVIDMIPDDDRSGPPFPLLFALTMLLMTEKGGTYTFAEYRRWLEEAGFTDVEKAEIGLHSPIVIATKTY